jgi:hypothetical protein
MPTPTSTLRTLGPKGRWLQRGSPDGFEWNLLTLPIADLPDGLVGTRIIHLSDLHTRETWHAAYDVLIDAVQDAKADLVLITGDFVDDKLDHTSAVPTITKLVSGLTAQIGVFGIMGNHDTLAFEPRLAQTHLTLLNGQRQVVHRNGCSIELIGMPGAERDDLTPDWLTAMARHERAPGVPRIVLAHDPDHLRLMRPLRPDVLLAGHTHGGQICLPGGIPIIRHDSLPRRHARGVHLIDGTWLVNHRGFGYTSLSLRVFCPSEVIEIELVRAPC